MKIKNLFKVLALSFIGLVSASILSGCSSEKTLSPNVLCLQFNDYLEEAQEDGSQNTMINFWFSIESESSNVDYESLVNVNGNLKVGLIGSTEPFSYVANNKFTGLNVDLMYRFAKKYHYSLSFEEYSSMDSLILAVKTGVVHMGAAPTTITEERQQEILFSKPYLNDETGIMIRKSDEGKIKSIADLAGKTYGVPNGSLFPQYVEKLAPNSKCLYFGSAAELCLALESNEIDAVVTDSSTCKIAVNHHTQLITFEEHLFDNLLGVMFQKKTYTTLKELEGKTIGMLDEEGMKRKISEKIPGSKQVLFGLQDWDKVVASLKDGSIDAVATYIDVIRYRSDKLDGYSVMNENVFSIKDTMVAPATKDGYEHISKFNDFVANNTSNYLFNKLKRKWVNEFYSGVKEAPDYVTLPNKNGVLKVGINDTFDPYVIIEQNKYKGICVDFLSFFAQEYGYALEFVNVSNLDHATMFDNGQLDLHIDLGHVVNDSYGYIRSDIFGENNVSMIVKDTLAIQPGFFETLVINFKKTFIVEDRYQIFVNGIATTSLITVASIVFGLILGFGFFILIRNTPKISKIVYKIINFIISGTPAVVFLMICYYIIFSGTNLGGVWVSIIAFSLIFMCSTVAFLDTGFNAIDKGQAEAAFTLGYSRSKTFTKILLPQAAKTFLPIFKGDVVSHIKATAIVGYIAVIDLTKASELVRSRTFDAFFSLIVATILYFLIEYLIIFLIKLIPVDPKKRKSIKALKGVKEDD